MISKSSIVKKSRPVDAVLRPARTRPGKGRVDEIAHSLGALIQNGGLTAGDRLPTETDIGTRFNVSRTVVREALSKMQAAALVETRHGIGTFVLDPPAGNFHLSAHNFATINDVISVLELRISLETEAAGLAAQRRNASNIGAIQNALTAFEIALHSDSDAVPSDFDFHLEVARATGNRHFADLMNYLGTRIIPRTRLDTPHSAPEGRLSYLQRVHAEHESIFNAIRNQDPDAARAAMRTHLSNSRDRLRKVQIE